MDIRDAYIQLLEAELTRTRKALQYHRNIHDVTIVKYGKTQHMLRYLRYNMSISHPQICRSPARDGDPRIHNSLLMQKWLGAIPDASVIIYISLWSEVPIPPRIVSDEYKPDLFHVFYDRHVRATMTRQNAKHIIQTIARLYADNFPVVDRYDI
jgi:hypothetical protein